MRQTLLVLKWQPARRMLVSVKHNRVKHIMRLEDEASLI